MNKNPQYNLKPSPTLKILAFLVFSLFFCQSLSSQFYWQKTYNSGGYDEAYDGCAADGSNFYLAGYAGFASWHMYILKLNQLGDTIWTRRYNGGVINAIAPSGDGGCVFTGQRNSCFTMKLDLNGNVVWDKSYPSGAETRDITQTGDSGYVMCGGLFTGYICKLDTLGNLQWERYYNDSPQDFDKIEPTDDGGYLVCGRKYISNNWKAYFMKIDGMGNIVWENFYQYPFGTSFVSTNNGFIFLSGFNIVSDGRIVLIKTDLMGNQLFADTLSRNTISDISPEILKLNNNKFVISYFSRISNTNGYIGKIIRIDSNLNIIKSISLSVDTNSIYLYNLIKAPGSSIDDIIVMGSAEPQGPFEVDLYAVRLDSSLTQPPPLTVNIISTQIPKEFDLVQNYPNPFNGTTLIKFSIITIEFVQIKVFDVLGREVETLVSENLLPGTYSKTFSPKNLASGIYFYQMSIAGKIIKTRKMIYNK
ncbi:MAG: T9SS type A sorting domain-containing protein [Ignavibacteria bacterium]|nr:T9SS type A sorting domain-containing protein [Ignavibacteria bacterium]HRJ86699.1 T9SS type A sorting domain-containing protein [Ignavibacteria bacterium]